MAPDRVGPGKVARVKVLLLDSSFLMAVMERPTPWKADIEERIGRVEPVVLSPVMRELERIAESGGGRARFASAAINYIRDSMMKVQAAPGKKADDELVSHALGQGALVATIDRGLVEQLRAAGVRVVFLSGGRVDLR